MRIGAVGLWVFVVLATACEQGTEPEVLEVDVPAVTLEARGDSIRLQALARGRAAEAEWRSLDPSVVVVDSGGLAWAVASGTARVEAVVREVVAMGVVTVLAPVDVKVSSLGAVTDPGGETGVRMRLRNAGGRGFYRLEFWRFDEAGRKKRVLRYANDVPVPAGLDVEYRNFMLDEPVDWVVAFSREPRGTALVRTGCARMDGIAEPCPSDLADPAVQVDSVTVSPAAAVLDMGDVVQYVARAFAGGVEVANPVAEWHTVSPEVISLSETGLAVALAPGYGQVQATVDGISSSVGLTVTSPDPGVPGSEVEAVVVRPGRVRLWAGQAWNMTATAYDGAWRPLQGRTVEWGVEDRAVAEVDTGGLLKGTGHGRTRVAATVEGVRGYAVVDSYVRPVDGADLVYTGLLSATADPSTVMPSIDTTWTDEHGVVHDAWIQVGPGSLTMEWGTGSGTYTQHLTLTTYVYDNPGVRKVGEDEYRDSGAVTRWYDFTTGLEHFVFTSGLVEGLTYAGTWSLPGELAVTQPGGAATPRTYYFRLAF